MARAQVTLTTVARRWSRAVEKGKGITLSASELDLMNAAGVGELLMSVAAAEQRETAKERVASKGAPTGKAPVPMPPLDLATIAALARDA